MSARTKRGGVIVRDRRGGRWHGAVRRRRSRAVPLIAVVIAFWAAQACTGDSSLAPVQPEDVTIRLAVSGGFAVADYSFVVDGAAGVVRGEACASLCDFEPGEILVPVSAAQVRDFAERLEREGILVLDGRDFGTRCCDQFHYTLTYERGGLSSTVRGSSEALPPSLARIAGELSNLATGTLQIIVAPESTDTAWVRDPYVLGRVDVNGPILTAEVEYGGGCADHRMDLVAWGGWLESFPVRVHVLLTHDDSDDPCDAVIREERSFDLTPLRDAYEDAYGRDDSGTTTIILMMWDPLAASPQGRLVEYVF